MMKKGTEMENKYGYTVEFYKLDKRCKSGEKIVEKVDYEVTNEDAMKSIVDFLYDTDFPRDKYRLEFFKTWVTKKNMMNGNEFQERYDTPYYCSPSSETYWSM
jgi:hypothetical protein